MNTKWKVIPEIAFVDGTTKVLTCKYHDGGNASMKIHTCRWKHPLTSDQPDQNLQVITQGRTFRKGKAGLYSTE